MSKQHHQLHSFKLTGNSGCAVCTPKQMQMPAQYINLGGDGTGCCSVYLSSAAVFESDASQVTPDADAQMHPDLLQLCT